LKALSINSTICFVSISFIHLVVIAGIPILSQEGLKGGLGSSGIVDLEVEIQILSSVSSAILQSNCVQEKSTTII